MTRFALAAAVVALLAVGAALGDDTDAPKNAERGLLESSVASRDWPMLQHDIGRTGRTSAPAIHDPVIAWRTWVGVCQWDSAPIVVGDRVFIATSGRFDEARDDMNGVRCLARFNGRPLWHHRTADDAMGVVWADGRVFATAENGTVLAVRAKDAKPLWTVKRFGGVDGDPLPILGRLAVGSSSTVQWYSQTKGTQMLRPIPVQTSAPPNLCSDGKRLFIAPHRRQPLSIDLAAEGDPETLKSAGAPDYGLPVIADADTVVYPFGLDLGFDAPQLVAAHTVGPGIRFDHTDRFAWVFEDEADKANEADDAPRDLHRPIKHPVAVYRKWTLHVRPKRGRLTAVDHHTGKVAWAIELGVRWETHTSGVVIADHTAYVGGPDGIVYAIDLRERAVRWTLDLSRDAHVRPRVPEGLLHAAPDGTVWEPPATRAVRSPMAIASDGMLLVATEGGYLYALRDAARNLKPPAPEPDPPLDGWVRLRIGDKLPPRTRLHLEPDTTVLIDIHAPEHHAPLITLRTDRFDHEFNLREANGTVLKITGNAHRFEGE